MRASLQRFALRASGLSRKFQIPCNYAAKQTHNAKQAHNARSLSTVAENTIQLNFVDVDGNRATIPALVGQTLLDVAERNEIDLEGPCRGGGDPTEVRRTENWVETTYGEGPTCFYCHVQIPNSFNHLLPEETQEMQDGIKGLWEDEVNTTSRLACMITLDKKHDGMTVYIPDAPPTDVI